MKIAICDDNLLELEKIQNSVQKFILLKQEETEITLNTFMGMHLTKLFVICYNKRYERVSNEFRRI